MIEFLPPRSPGREITIDGYLVPRVEVGENPATGKWTLMLDGRYGVEAENIEELHRWIWIIANALAIGEGYSCHGENSVWRPNPYKVKAHCIGHVRQAPPDGHEGGVTA